MTALSLALIILMRQFVMRLIIIIITLISHTPTQHTQTWKNVYSAAAIGDLDGDGITEVAVMMGYNKLIVLFLNPDGMSEKMNMFIEKLHACVEKTQTFSEKHS